ncbi:MAG: hypothetical protein D6760_06725, partial [Deltaproteobacteria bacterium]
AVSTGAVAAAALASALALGSAPLGAASPISVATAAASSGAAAASGPAVAASGAAIAAPGGAATAPGGAVAAPSGAAAASGKTASAGTSETASDKEDPGYIEKRSERGPVSAVVRLEPSHPVIGDRCTLTLRVTAEDGVEVLMPDFGQSLDRFMIREFVPRQRVGKDGSTIYEQRYILEPPMSGRLTIPPLLIEFVDHRPGHKPAPEDEDAYELLTEPLPFEVKSVTPKSASEDMRPVAGKLDPLPAAGSRSWLWWAIGLLAAAAAGAIAWRQVAAIRSRARRRSAFDVALSRLEALAARPRPATPDAIDAFFVELSSIVRRYLEDRFELRAPELTTEEFLQAAGRTPELTEAHRGFLRDFLKRADMVKFARFIPEQRDIDAALRAARRFLHETRERPAAGAPPAAAAAEEGARA